jgi:predicted adenine nucleotide alpha hydrolase (AANH) superfamily ATPase
MQEKILLLVCCAPCATASIKRLEEQGYEVINYFYNPNIFPNEEHDRRYAEFQRLCAEKSYVALDMDYEYQKEHRKWLAFIKGLENEPEHGRRCVKCFEFRLKRVWEKMKELELKAFTSTLTISPHKDSEIIHSIGRGFTGFKFFDFKKKAGFEESVRMSKELGLYRQRYCGCEFSMRD